MSKVTKKKPIQRGKKAIETLTKFESLAKRVKGEVCFDEVTRVAYSTDASIYQIVPDAVFMPADSEDVRKVVEFSKSYRIPLISRGAGTNMTGAALGKGIVIDFSKYMNRILEIDAEKGWAVVEPGVIHGRLQTVLKQYSKFFPPDPSSSDYCTIGGVVANNSSGIHGVKYGDAKDWVLDITAVLADGTTISTEVLNEKKNLHFLSSGNAVAVEDSLSFRVFSLLRENAKLIKSCGPQVSKNSSGYNLAETYKGTGLDWNKLFTGSEGTLGVFTRIKLKLADLPRHKILFLAAFKNIEDSTLKLRKILDFKPSACELLDDYLIRMIRKENPKIESYLPEGTGAVLLVEFASNEAREIESAKRDFPDLLKELAVRVDVASKEEDQNFLWGVRKAASPIINRVEGREKPVRMVEDVAVSPDKIGSFIKDFKEVLAKHDLKTSVYGHVGAGNLHINPNVDLTLPGYRNKIRSFTKEAYDLVRRYDGTIAGEHGDGLLRPPFVNTQFGRLVEVFRKIKFIFDPRGILNPGKKISHSTSMNLDSLRYDYEYGKAFRERWGESLHEEIAKCHGCGTCRMYCPVASVTLDERDTARSKLNLIKMLASGSLPADDRTLKEVAKVIDHCVNCKQCLVSCPTVVDVPRLCVEARKMLKERFGADFADRYVGDIKPIVKKGAGFGRLSNFFLKNRAARAIMDLFLGIDSRRVFPEFKRVSFPKVRGLGISDGNRRVVYHPGCFAEYNDPDEVMGTLQILKAAKVLVETPDMDCCYVSSITSGAYTEYMGLIEENLRFLKGYVDKGYKIITSSASCGLAFKLEYPQVLGSRESIVVSENSYDIHEYLIGLKAEGLLNLDFRRKELRVVFHNPCHIIARKSGIQPEDLIRMVPGVEVVKIEDSCCGMAGTFGMKKKNFELSMKMGEKLFREIIESGADLVVTSCGTCKMQIEQGTGKKVVHTMKFLADSLL